MANSKAVIRTNYFAVTDAGKLRQIMESCDSNGDSIELFEKNNSSSGQTLFGFGCHSSILGLRVNTGDNDYEDYEYDLDAFYKALQAVIAENDAIIITEVGYEKLCYVAGSCVIITWSEIRVFNLEDKALEEARDMLGNPEYTTEMDY